MTVAGILAAAAASALTLAPDVPSLPAPAPEQAVEFVHYRVADADAFPALHAETFDRLRAMPGFVQSHAFRSLQRPDMFLDVVVWRDLDAAQAASQAVMADPAFAPFMGAVAEVGYADHFTGALRVDFAEARPGDVTEVVIYDIRADADDAFAASRPGFVEALRRQGAARGFLSAQSASQGSVHLDMALWPSLDAAKAAEQAVMASPEGQAAFSTMAGAPKMMDFFTLIETVK